MISSGELRRLKTVAELVPHFIASRAERNLRPATMVNYHVWARALIRHWGTKAARRITDGMICGLVTSRSRNFAEVTRVFFRWLIAMKVLRRDFDLGQLPRAPRTDERQISYLSPASARCFLQAVRPEYLAGFTLQLYAGLRPYEAARMDWRDVHMQQRRIRISAAVSKIRRYRVIEGVPAILWRLLRPLAKQSGRVMPGGDDMIAVMRAMHERARAARVSGVQLSHDVLRHTFATYFAAWTGHAAMCSRILGHYRLGTLIAHYDGAATKAEANDFFGKSAHSGRTKGL
jgi:integrase